MQPPTRREIPTSALLAKLVLNTLERVFENEMEIPTPLKFPACQQALSAAFCRPSERCLGSQTGSHDATSSHVTGAISQNIPFSFHH